MQGGATGEHGPKQREIVGGGGRNNPRRRNGAGKEGATRGAFNGPGGEPKPIQVREDRGKQNQGRERNPEKGGDKKGILRRAVKKKGTKMAYNKNFTKTTSEPDNLDTEQKNVRGGGKISRPKNKPRQEKAQSTPGNLLIDIRGIKTGKSNQ